MLLRSISNYAKLFCADCICYDFSTFFTNVLHGKLIRTLNEHMHFCFNGGDGELIVVIRYRAQWSNRKKTGSTSLLEAL